MITRNTPTAADIDYLANNIREHDIEEMKTMYGDIAVHRALVISVAHSEERWTFKRNGAILGIGGIAETNQYPGFTIWFIGSTDAELLENQVALIRHWRELIKLKLQKYMRLSNYCSSDPGQLRVMKVLGFRIEDTNNDEVKFITCA